MSCLRGAELAQIIIQLIGQYLDVKADFIEDQQLLIQGLILTQQKRFNDLRERLQRYLLQPLIETISFQWKHIAISRMKIEPFKAIYQPPPGAFKAL